MAATKNKMPSSRQSGTETALGAYRAPRGRSGEDDGADDEITHIAEHVGARLRQRREKHGWTIRQLSLKTEGLGKSRKIQGGRISRIENGLVNPDIREIAILCDALGLSRAEAVEPPAKPYFINRSDVIAARLREALDGSYRVKRTSRAHEDLIDKGDRPYRYVPLTDDASVVKQQATPPDVQGALTSPLMQKFIFVIQSVSDSELFKGLDRHWGEEIIYVVKNNVWAWFADVPDKDKLTDASITKLLLHEGDCLHFSSELLHGFSAYREPATALFVYSDAGAPPQFRVIPERKVSET